MKLPKLDVRMFQVALPSTGQKLTLRPFLVSEERILLEAARTENQVEIANAMKQIVNNCVTEEIDLNNCPTFDMEYLFVQLRSQSVGESQEVVFEVDDHDTSKGMKCEGVGQSVETSIDLSKAKVSNLEKAKGNTKFMITDNIGIEMRYPTLEDTGQMTQQDVDTMFQMIKTCIKQVYTTDGDIYEPDQLDEGELDNFINSMNTGQFGKINEFFDQMPKLGLDVPYRCPVCSKPLNKYLEGMASFF